MRGLWHTGGGALGKNRQAKKTKTKKRAGPFESAGPVAYATFATRLIRYCRRGLFRTVGNFCLLNGYTLHHYTILILYSVADRGGGRNKGSQDRRRVILPRLCLDLTTAMVY